MSRFASVTLVIGATCSVMAEALPAAGLLRCTCPADVDTCGVIVHRPSMLKRDPPAMKHNVYYALTASDEYVWCYSERMNWWQDNVPEGAEAAIRTARDLVTQGQTDQAERLRAEVAESSPLARRK